MKILLVEEDERLSAKLTQLLEANLYRVELAREEQTGLKLAAVVSYDLILLDGQLPGLDGIQLCRKLRSQGYANPILLMLASDLDADAVSGFEAGADDCVNRSCTSEILLARIRTLLRRSGAIAGNSSTAPVNHFAQTLLRWGDLSLNLDAGRVTIADQIIPLTATEYNLLELFLRNPERIFSRSAILDKLWGFDDAPTDRAIVTHIKDLRKKIKAGGLSEDLLETVYGMGYRLKPAPRLNTGGNTEGNTGKNTGENIGRNTGKNTGNNSTKIDRVLEKFRDTFAQQISVLEAAKVVLLSGHLCPALQAAAKQEAHKLAGSLATFGYPDGSKLARSLEHLLIKNSFTPIEINQFAEQIEALQQALAKPPVSQNLSLPDRPNYRLLIIDDDRALTQQFSLEATAGGMQIQVAFTPIEARSILAQVTFDVILLDLSFPDATEDGFSLLQEINQQFPNLPVIVFTGRDSLADRLAASRSGAKQFLQKPATPQQIFQAIAQVLPSSKAPEARVLLVDDDRAVLALLSSLLTPWGIETVTLSEPDRFWQVLVETSPDLVLLDLEMPDVNGLELCQVVRQDARWGNLPILVVTAHTAAESLHQAFAAGADDFITKPVLGPELVTRILSRIERSSLHQNPPSRPSPLPTPHSPLPTPDSRLPTPQKN